MDNNDLTKQKQNYRFFSHTECEYFPCHETERIDEFNCLFCFCPLYMLADQCGGNFEYTQEGNKDCSRCMIPHCKQGYDYIIEKYKVITDAMKVSCEK